jgi:hypothetical protein
MTAQRRIAAKNLTAGMSLTDQLRYRAAGNPPTTQLDSAISNCFPGLEFDFRNVWRRILEGIEVHEAGNLVVDVDPKRKSLKKLVGHRLLYVDHYPTFVEVWGPKTPGGANERLPDASEGANPMEWSNALAEVLHKSAGKLVPCWFTANRVDGGMGVNLDEQAKAARTPGTRLPHKPTGLIEKMLRVNRLFATTPGGSKLAVIDERLVGPGELTQSLCSPWQNDYRECACYYWAASRPDYVNVEDSGLGETIGNHWLAKNRQKKEYIADDSIDSRLWTYDELFRGWQEHLRFIVGGKDVE